MYLLNSLFSAPFILMVFIFVAFTYCFHANDIRSLRVAIWNDSQAYMTKVRLGLRTCTCHGNNYNTQRQERKVGKGEEIGKEAYKRRIGRMFLIQNL